MKDLETGLLFFGNVLFPAGFKSQIEAEKSCTELDPNKHKRQSVFSASEKFTLGIADVLRFTLLLKVFTDLVLYKSVNFAAIAAYTCLGAAEGYLVVDATAKWLRSR